LHNWKTSYIFTSAYIFPPMKKLTRKEEELMKILWNMEKGFVKDILARYPKPKPHYNTVSSLVRTLQEKKMIGFKQYGNTYEYFPLTTKEDYRTTFMQSVIRDYFDNSYKNAVSFFIQDKNLKPEELEEIIKLIKKDR
jgi:BlaI family transcriptional regulator, penicillinase repressor